MRSQPPVLTSGPNTGSTAITGIAAASTATAPQRSAIPASRSMTRRPAATQVGKQRQQHDREDQQDVQEPQVSGIELGPAPTSTTRSAATPGPGRERSRSRARNASTVRRSLAG